MGSTSLQQATSSIWLNPQGGESSCTTLAPTVGSLHPSGSLFVSRGKVAPTPYGALVAEDCT
jgi:hypothetical protein